MKGLPLAKEYNNQLGAPMLRERFPELVDRIAVGFVGPGSECFGFDDEISRDHDWGPAFCMWLTADDYRKYGKDLQKAYDELPKVFQGFGPRRSSPGEEFRVGVSPMETFYATYTGLDHPPVTPKEWIPIPESSLAVCTNGQVFFDQLGQFSRWRQALLAFYPEDLHLKKIASRCFTIAQSGQYNLTRSLRRGELSTYSLKTLEVYLDHIGKEQSEKVNGSAITLLYMMKQYGFASLEEANEKMKSRF